MSVHNIVSNTLVSDQDRRMMAKYAGYSDAALSHLVARGELAEYNQAVYWRERALDFKANAAYALATTPDQAPVMRSAFDDHTPRLSVGQAVRASVLPAGPALVAQRADLVQRGAFQQAAQPQQVQRGVDPEIRAGLANLERLMRQKMAIEAQQARRPQQVQRAAVQQQAGPGREPHLTHGGYVQTPASGHQDAQAVYSIRDAVRMQARQPLTTQPAPAPQKSQARPMVTAAALPVSPVTGKPSKLTQQMRRSVGIIE